ncbi:MAG: hypothetical protein KAR79_06250, partial [Simkaniaceae bacterium]|nr:hypothetical protein [Simkaniaceae bacterium]
PNDQEKEISTLFERCEDLSLNKTIDTLVEKSQKIASDPLLTQVKEVQQTIKSLTKNNALTWENLQFIGLAKQLLAKAEGVFHMDGSYIKPPTLNALAPPYTHQEIIDITTDLFEIAGSIYNLRINEGLGLIKTLPKEIQARLGEHLITLGGSVDALYVIEDRESHKNNSFLIIKSLLGLAKEVAGLKDLYPTNEEIDEMFGELQKIIG